jgi:hypothetical protein
MACTFFVFYACLHNVARGMSTERLKRGIPMLAGDPFLWGQSSEAICDS